MYQQFCLVLAMAIILAAGCDSDSPQKSDNGSSQPTLNRRVAVTNFPLFCFVKQICDSKNDPSIEVVYVGPLQGDDPHSWTPAAEQIRDLQQVDLVIGNGPGAVFANWFSRVTLDESKLCNTTDAISLKEFVVVKDYQLVHSHGPEGEHSHAWVVAHSWLSPKIARKQATFCYQRIAETYGESKSLDDGFAQLSQQFDELETAAERLKLKLDDVVVTASTPEALFLTRALGCDDRYLTWSNSPDESKVAEATEQIGKLNERFGEADVETKTRLLLWTTPPIGALDSIVNANWDATAEISRIDTFADKSYFEAMAANYDSIERAIQASGVNR